MGDMPFKKFNQDRRSGRERRKGQAGEQHSAFRLEGSGAQDWGVLDWLEAEQQGNQQRRRDRRSGVERRGSVQNRREERRLIPFSVAPQGRVSTLAGQHWHCTLWDLSYRGLCLVAQGSLELPLGSTLQVALTEVVGLGSVEFKAELRWYASDAFQTYLGLRFQEPDTLPKDSFLERYHAADFD